MKKILKNTYLCLLCFGLILSMCGCFSAERIASDNPETEPETPINLYTSAEVNRYIMVGEARNYVVDQYGTVASDCSVDDEGNILLNGKLIIPSDKTEFFTRPNNILLENTYINLTVNQPLVPDVLFLPENTSCKEYEIQVVQGNHQTATDGRIYFTEPGEAICRIISSIDPELYVLCYITIYNTPDEFPQTDNNIVQQGEVFAGDYWGIDREIYFNWLNLHKNDDYYLGTPYDGNDARRPNGNTPEGQTPGMNCTGFVWHVLYATAEQSNGRMNAIPGMTGWSSFYKSNNIRRYSFNTKEDMLASGVLEQGDIIWIWDENGESGRSNTHHIGIYMGDGHSDIWWHSLNGAQAGFPIDGNMISHIGSIVEPYKFVVLDMYE